MKYAVSKNTLSRLIILCVGLFALTAFSAARTMTTSVNIVNNSDRAIRNVYLSHVNVDDWGNNQLSEGTTIAAGQSFNLGNVACDQQQVKVIAEDQDGCFASTVVSCGNSATWTITNDTARDCGGN
ncbi:MAG: hypothetical protein QOI77_466 [Blastocatellia bacterium]|jgi:hypothetical protein|nr:hypothetical protein [Blastocatellia bacterium]